jgi:hypothetical protein
MKPQALIGSLHGVERAICVAMLLAFSTSGFASETPSQSGDLSPRYAAIAPITLVPQEGVQRLSLPLPVLQASRSTSWADVRVLDGAGRPVPTAWLPATPQVSNETDAQRTSTPLPRFVWPTAPTTGETHLGAEASNLRVQVNSSGAVVKIESSKHSNAATVNKAVAPRVWLLDLSALPRPGKTIQQLQLDWPAQPQGVSNRVDVQGSMDAQRWSPITSGLLLELPAPTMATAASDTSAPPASTQGAPGVKHVAWPSGVAMPRYLRLSFEQPLALSSAHLRWVADKAPAPLSTTTVQFQAVAADGQQPAHWALDLQGAVPLQQLQLSLPQINTVLALRLEQRNHEREPWRSVTTWVAWRLLRDGKEQESSPVQWGSDTRAPTAARHWRLVPDARTAALPMPALTATLGWQSPQLLLVAQGGGALRLAVGRERDTGSSVAWQTLVPGADDAALQRLPEAGLGLLAQQVVAEPPFNQRLQEATPEDQQRWLLWGVLTLAVVGLGVLAWRLGKDTRMDQRER